MEISSPFLSQEDCSHFYSLFQDMESFNVNANPKKRQRKEDDVSDKEETKKTALRGHSHFDHLVGRAGEARARTRTVGYGDSAR
jgi:hypothetical protein